MTYLLDTHIFLWWLNDDSRLPNAARDVISHGSNTVYLSSVSVAEMAIKSSNGKLQMPVSIAEATNNEEFEPLPFTAKHAVALETLPWHHRDPFDRMLIAQAQIDNLTFITVDVRCRQYEVKVL